MTALDHRPGVGEGEALAPGRPQLVITVFGTPAPQGSKTRGRYSLYDDNAKTLKPWREAVCRAAGELAWQSSQWPLITGPCTIEVTVTLARPAYHYRTGRYAHLLRDNAPAWPTGRGSGDSDKYLRAACDAITDSGLWVDDVLAVESLGRKVWTDTGIDALPHPGAVIRIHPISTKGDPHAR